MPLAILSGKIAADLVRRFQSAGPASRRAAGRQG